MQWSGGVAKYNILWIGLGSALLTSVVGKPNIFHLIIQTIPVLRCKKRSESVYHEKSSKKLGFLSFLIGLVSITFFVLGTNCTPKKIVALIHSVKFLSSEVCFELLTCYP